MFKFDDAEASIISTMIKNPSKRGTILTIMGDRPDEFFSFPEPKVIYSTISKAHAEKGEVDIDSLITESGVDSTLVKTLWEFPEVSSGNIPRYLAKMRQNSLDSDLKTKYFKDVMTVLASPNASIDDKVGAMRDMFNEVESRRTSLKPLSRTAKNVVDDYMKVLDEREKGVVHYPTGDKRLDAALVYGYCPKNCTTIVGRPGHGKSLYSTRQALRLSNMGVKTVIFNQEMNNSEVVDRMVALSLPIPPSRLTRFFHELSDVERKSVREEAMRLSGLSFHMNDYAMSMDDVEREIQQIQNQNGQEYMVVYIDLFTRLKDFFGAASPLDFEKITNRFQEMYKRVGIHAVPLIQLNREAEKEKIKNISEVHKLYPQTSNIKNSDAFLANTDNVILICRPHKYLHTYQWGEFVEPYTRVELAKQRAINDNRHQDNIMLYRDGEGRLDLVDPPEGWDPLDMGMGGGQ